MVVIGASAGGVVALRELVAALPADLAAAVFVVLHVPAGAKSVLPSILARAGALPAQHVEGEIEIERANIYVAPPDLHLQFDDGRVRAVPGPRENGHRPAVDPLFRSAAHVFGPRTIGVILSGALDDGTLGLRAIKAHGGMALVQDPEDAEYDGMPRSAIAFAAADTVGTPRELAAAIVELANDAVESDPEGEPNPLKEHAEDVARQADEKPQPGEDTGLTCPECGGAIWIQENGNAISFRCRVGHQYAAESFAVDQGTTVEAALWSALRLMEERVVLMRSLADKFVSQRRTAASFAAKADALERHATTLRATIDDVARAVAADEEVA